MQDAASGGSCASGTQPGSQDLDNSAQLRSGCPSTACASSFKTGARIPGPVEERNSTVQGPHMPANQCDASSSPPVSALWDGADARPESSVMQQQQQRQQQPQSALSGASRLLTASGITDAAASTMGMTSSGHFSRNLRSSLQLSQPSPLPSARAARYADRPCSSSACHAVTPDQLAAPSNPASTKRTTMPGALASIAAATGSMYSGATQRRTSFELATRCCPAGKDDHGWVQPGALWSSAHRAQGGVVQPELNAGRRFVRMLRLQLAATGRVLARDRVALLAPLALLCLLLPLGLYGVLRAQNETYHNRRVSAYNAARDKAQALSSHIQATVSPATTSAMIVKLMPNWTTANDSFYKVAPQLMENRERDALLTLVLVPNGIVQAIIPQGLPGWDKVYGLDLLKDPAWRPDALKTVRARQMVMTGPSRLRAGMMGLVARYPIFIPGVDPNTTWGAPGEPHECGDACYIPETRSKWWGFAQLNVDWYNLTHHAARLYELCTVYHFGMEMTYVDPVNGSTRVVASCGRMHPDTLSTEVAIMNNKWTLSVSDAWYPSWRVPAIVGVVLGSVMLAGLLAVVLISRRQHMWLLESMLPKRVITSLRYGHEFAETFECVTILFSDIVQYTDKCGSMTPIEVMRMLNSLYSVFDELTLRHNVYKVETIGDAFMAVTGCPTREDPVAAAARMARMAKEMIEAVTEFETSQGQQLQIRIGLHSGPVVAGVVGSRMPRYCLFGDTVNTASRMESNSRPMKVHVSQATAELLMQHNVLAPPGKAIPMVPRETMIEVKGKGPMKTYWLIHLLEANDANSPNDSGAMAQLMLPEGMLGEALVPTPLGADLAMQTNSGEVQVQVGGSPFGSSTHAPVTQVQLHPSAPPRVSPGRAHL